MLENWIKPQIPEEEELDERLHAARSKLSVLQMQIKEHGLPVLVLFEGWGTAGKGSVLGKVIKNIDPRFFKVATMDEPTEEERRKPFLYRYFVKIPAKGKFEFLDSGWMDEVVKDVLHDKIGEKEYKKKIESVKRFERQLTDNGYLVMKFFFQISRKEQKKRIEVLKENKDTRWRVSGDEDWQNKHYDKCMHVFDRYLNDTNSPADPWYIVDAKNRKWAELQVLETLVSGIETALKTVILLCRCYRMCSRLRRFQSFLRYHLIRNCLRKNTKRSSKICSLSLASCIISYTGKRFLLS